MTGSSSGETHYAVDHCVLAEQDDLARCADDNISIYPPSLALL